MGFTEKHQWRRINGPKILRVKAQILFDRKFLNHPPSVPCVPHAFLTSAFTMLLSELSMNSTPILKVVDSSKPSQLNQIGLTGIEKESSGEGDVSDSMNSIGLSLSLAA